ncbi:hypothetical protein Z517_05299 [Fonsecaea pedrosoi CBS 271.37]|uniref:Thioesterase domain-containing protein n=1 Tax=Fonsecaea pedrosoi CBS 271.37 TaxID=1442368 RepID=A0A0D2F6G9_9EURO|nr:uncharacterized protein Z517_05299 [Fonsecaea pedrosoi CBS 271.37]KIW82272.1 hypothetical protein Z517_05299 [Fonsecaea pedrosoi CBS 271.37]
MTDSEAPKAERYSTDLLKIPGMAFEITEPDPKKRIEAYIQAYRNPEMAHVQTFDLAFMRDHITVVSASTTPEKTTAVFEMKAAPLFTNRMGNMHGGAVAMIHDMCTTMAAAPLARRDFWWFGGVSRTLLITYLRPVRQNMDLVIECQVLQQGTRLSTIRGEMRDKRTGQLLSVAEHNKASINFVEAKSKI